MYAKKKKWESWPGADRDVESRGTGILFFLPSSEKEIFHRAPELLVASYKFDSGRHFGVSVWLCDCNVFTFYSALIVNKFFFIIVVVFFCFCFFREKGTAVMIKVEAFHQRLNSIHFLQKLSQSLSTNRNSYCNEPVRDLCFPSLCIFYLCLVFWIRVVDSAVVAKKENNNSKCILYKQKLYVKAGISNLSVYYVGTFHLVTNIKGRYYSHHCKHRTILLCCNSQRIGLPV